MPSRSHRRNRSHSRRKSRKSSSKKSIRRSSPRKSSSGKQVYKLYRSSLSGKKYDVYVPKGNGLKKVSFGAQGYSDYTKHKDSNRRSRYRSRHSKDKVNDPYRAGFWAWRALWGASGNLQKDFAAAVRAAKQHAN
jgi:hypothetical protein